MGTWPQPISRRRKSGGTRWGSLCLEMFLRHLSEELVACWEHPGARFQGSASWLNPVSENTGAFPAQEGPCRGLGSQPHVRAQAEQTPGASGLGGNAIPWQAEAPSADALIPVVSCMDHFSLSSGTPVLKEFRNLAGWLPLGVL